MSALLSLSRSVVHTEREISPVEPAGIMMWLSGRSLRERLSQFVNRKRTYKRRVIKSVGHLPLFLALVCTLASPTMARAGDRARTKDLPSEVAMLIDRATECQHLLSGEFADAIPAHQVERDRRLLRCDYLAFEIAVLRGKYSGSPQVLHVLGKVGIPFGEPYEQ